MESSDLSVYNEKLFPAVAKGAKEAGRKPDEIRKMLEVNVSYDEDYERARWACKRWGTIMIPEFYKQPISDPREIEAQSARVDVKELEKVWIISSDPDEHIRQLERYIREGFADIHTCDWGVDEYKYIDVYSKHVIPYFKSNYS